MDEKIKILYVLGTLRVGGAEKHLVGLLRGLDQEKFDPAVCCISKEGDFIPLVEEMGVPILDLGIDRYYSLKALRRFFFLVRYIKAERFHIVHCFLFLANIFGALAAYLAGKPKIVISIRSMNLFFTARHIYTVRFIGRLADRITVVSHQVKNLVLKREKLNPHKISIIPNGVDLKSLEGPVDKARKREEIGIEKADPVLGCVANLHEKKGHRYLLQALAGVIPEYPGLVLLLAGDGEEKAAIRGQVKALNLNGHVKFLNHRHDVPELLEIMDVFILPSLEEGMSNALLEAMAIGKPAVVTDVGGNPEAAIHGETGLVIPVRDAEAMKQAILTLLRDKHQAAVMGKKGRERIKNYFSLKKLIDKNEAIYLDLMGRNS